jgi:cell division protein FtsB
MTKPILSKLPKWLTDKYLLSVAFFVAWMLFFDHNDIVLQWKRTRELKALNEARDHYRDQIAETRRQLEEMRSSPIALEKVAREKYLMKKDNEELFVITTGDR